MEEIKLSDKSMGIVKTMVKDTFKEALDQAYCYIIDVTNKQGFIMEAKVLYGDGTRFPLLTLAGFKIAYDQAKEDIKF
jgi:hypothetical protein